MENNASVPSVQRSSIWPLLIAPFVAGLYYLVLKSAFDKFALINFGDGARNVGDFDPGVYLGVNLWGVGLGLPAGPIWGLHWLGRISTEIFSVGIATLVAAGLARGSEFAAAVLGGISISLVYAALTLLLVFDAYQDPEFETSTELWYQDVINGSLIFIAPIVAYFISPLAQEFNKKRPVGFGGINRSHFFWLFVPVHWYAFGLIWPVSRLLTRSNSLGVVDMLAGAATGLSVSGLQIATLLVPGYYGLALLSGDKGSNLHSTKRNLLGFAVLILGGLSVAAIQFGLFLVFRTLVD